MLIKIEDNLIIESLDVQFATEIFNLVDKNRLRLKRFLGWLDNINNVKDEENYIKEQNKEIITKCCKKLIEYGFNILDLESIIIHCDIQNIKSENVAKRLNFDFVKIVKNYCNLYGIWSDSKEYLLKKDKYNAAIAQ